ncbi:Ribosome biogenesis protein erb1, partial [Modicella reniformis]
MPSNRPNKKAAAAPAKVKPTPATKAKPAPAPVAKARLVPATKTKPAPTKKAIIAPIVAKSKKRTVAEAQQESDDEFGEVAIDMASDDEEYMGDDSEGDEDEVEEFPEEDGQDMSSADIEYDDEDNDSEESYMDGDSIVDSQEENEDEDEHEDDDDEDDMSDFGNLKDDDIDPNFGHNLNEPLPVESDYNPIRREYPEIDPVYDSDSSTEENENTVGNVPMHWYDEYPHIGYDINGKKIMKPATADELDKFLSTMDDPDSWQVLYHSCYFFAQSEELDIIRRLECSRIPDADYDPYEDQIEFFTSKTEVMPLSAAPEPKRRFIPSKHEAKRVMKIVRAIREGRIVPRKSGHVPPKPKYYNLWNDAEDKPKEDHIMHITAPKMKLPTHDESYNPPAEYLPTEEEINEWNELDKEDRPKNYLPQKYNSLRNVPGYNRFIQERFERCLDLYLAPRVRKNRLNIDPESLIPKLPSPRDLQPFPTRLAIEFLGHKGRVRSISVDPTGLWLASGSDDKTVRVWEIATGRCMTTYRMDELVTSV